VWYVMGVLGTGILYVGGVCTFYLRICIGVLSFERGITVL
jgi:hypothetical protein